MPFALRPMLVALLGIVKLARLRESKAKFRMLVTGRLLIVPGVTVPPEPMHSVMVMAPFLVAKMNWACTAEGSTNNSSSGGSSLVPQALLKRAAGGFGQGLPAKLENGLLTRRRFTDDARVREDWRSRGNRATEGED
jgi:hypothetical protein